MQEKTILKVAIVVTIIGLAFLFLYAGEVELKAVERIDSAIPEETVEMTGIVSRVSQHDKVIFLELEGQRIEKVDVILFTDENIFLKAGDYVEISGTIEEYEGKREIIANKIMLK